DQPGFLEFTRDKADAGTMHAQHVSQELLREIKTVAFGAIVRHQQPSCEAFLDAVQTIAGDRLQYLAQISLEETLRHTSQRRITLGKLPEAGDAHAHADTGNLANGGSGSTFAAGQYFAAAKTFIADGRRLDRRSVLQYCQNGKDGTAREIHILDRVV